MLKPKVSASVIGVGTGQLEHAVALAIAGILAVRLVWLGLRRHPALAVVYLASLASLIVSYQSTNALFMSLIWIVLAGGIAITLREPGAETGAPVAASPA